MTDYFKPSVTVDVLVFSFINDQLQLLLIQRKHDPFAEAWALPGGFIEPEETLLQSAQRELQEETGLTLNQLFFTGIYGNPGRDPRGRTISAAYRTDIIWGEAPGLQAQDDAKDARWYSIAHLPALAFDHLQIIEDAISDLYAALTDQYPGSTLNKKTTQTPGVDTVLKQIQTLLQTSGKLDALD